MSPPVGGSQDEIVINLWPGFHSWGSRPRLHNVAAPRLQSGRLRPYWPGTKGASSVDGKQAINASLSPCPTERPAHWSARVNAALTASELDRGRMSINRGRPYGAVDRITQTVAELGLEYTVRRTGRPA
jgi:hypothetical protein